MKKTALYSEHQKLNAKLVPFAGWSMPLHYGSQIQEHHAVRQKAGLFDVSHMRIIDLSGSGSRDFLRYILANDVAKLNPGQALYSCMLNESGGVIDDLIVYRLAQNYRLVVNAGTADQDQAWLNEQAKSFSVQIQARSDLALIALQGPQSADYLNALLPVKIKPFYSTEIDGLFIARTGYTGEDGFEISAEPKRLIELWRQWIELGVQPCGLGARDTLRLEAGLNLYGQDMDENHSPLVSGLAWTVDFKDNERHFIGKNALLTQKPSTKLTGIILKDKGVLRAGQPLFSEQKQVGYLTSGGFAPSLGHAIGLARIDLNAPSDLKVQIRNKKRPVQTVQPPFIKKNRIR